MTLLALTGWCATACFFSRGILQWYASERAGRSVAPMSYWWVSLAGAAMFGIYSTGKGEWVLLAGNALNASIYARNLWLGSAKRKAAWSPSYLVFGVLVLLVVMVAAYTFDPGLEFRIDSGWLICAIVGQSLWSSRFVVQWWASEKDGKSHLPRSFWLVSLAGNTLLLSYALHLGDPIFVAGYVLGPFVQVRNLVLGAKERQSAKTPKNLRAKEPETNPSALG